MPDSKINSENKLEKKYFLGILLFSKVLADAVTFPKNKPNTNFLLVIAFHSLKLNSAFPLIVSIPYLPCQPSLNLVKPNAFSPMLCK
ncbi:Uncharacterised protein [Chlamydia abortus]|nr:Uncharacterised protein [Chlamydia abortus]